MPERREGEMPMIDVTEQFLSLAPTDFLEFMSKQVQDKYIQIDFSQLDEVKRKQVESLLWRKWFKTVAITATGEEIKSNPDFFSLAGIEVFPKD